MPVEQKTDTERELGEIRREVIESRNLVIKTDNLLKNLHAEVKSVGKRQEDFQKRQFLSSAVAYVLFALICGAGGIGYAIARSSSSTQERDRLEKTVADLSAQVEKQKTEAQATQLSQRAGADVYRMMTTLPGDERLKGIDALMKLETTRLTPLERQALNDRAVLLRKEAGQASFERGKTAYRRNDMATTVTELTRFVAMNPEPQDLLEASFYLGSAYNVLKKHEQAVPYLARYVSEDKHSKSRPYAILLLGQSYEQTGQLDKGAELVREAIGAYPNSEFLPQWKARLSSIKRLQGAGTDSPDAPPPSPAPAPTVAPKATPNKTPF